MALIRYSRLRCFTSVTALLVAITTVGPTPAYAQEEGPDAPDTGDTGYSSLNVSQPRGTRELQNALQRLALNPADIDALIDGGNAALLLGDPQAAIGFFARADEMSPGNGRVKAGLGSGLLLNENPYEALRLFEEAKKLGVPETVFAADRGLAYDLVGNSGAAQADYELALRRGNDDETIRRYALSLAIAGDRTAAEAQLDPLLRRRDAAAWRTRAFVLAVSGDPQGAIAIADATMPKRMAASIEPFFRFMGRLTPAQQAAAAHFGQFPQTAAIGKDDPRNRQYASAGVPRVRAGRADSGLIPAGDPLGPTTESKTRKTAQVDKSSRRRPGKLSKKERAQIASAQAAAAAAPVPVDTRPPGPVPPPDLLIPGRGVATQSASAQPAPGTVQPLPGASQPRLGTVQALPGSAPRSVATVQPLPGATAPTSSGQSAPLVQPTPRADVAASRQAAATATPPVAVTPPTSASRTPSVGSPLIPDGTTAVVLAGVTELPRPGFRSVPPVSNGASAASAGAGPAQPSRGPAQAIPQGPPPATGSGAPGQTVQTVQAVETGQQTPPSARAPADLRPGFDLAQVGQPSAPSPAPSPVATASAASSQSGASVGSAPPAPERITLSAVIAGIKVPPQELAPDENAVDITKITPAAPKPPEVKKPEDKKAEAKKAEAKKAAAKPAPPKHPKRYWVQVAGGANRADLAKEWKRLTGEAPAVFKGKQAWWTPLNATNRLLAGPFSGPNEAQTFVNTLAKNKLSGFAFTSPEGQEVTKIGG
ncbi:SPOR domain-containing protein [Blastomonas sp.]|uniref:SPOR domain-containing protein n=1 Tax=Blastomonas sp. TaxID=1909299 RepID=UPI00261A55D9|nr:SPOR domain-containing protein [Blastomonas sp.]MDM7955043.1 SPOR domain-containing protein [Blastomonas sp.]